MKQMSPDEADQKFCHALATADYELFQECINFVINPSALYGQRESSSLVFLLQQVCSGKVGHAGWRYLDGLHDSGIDFSQKDEFGQTFF